jgi:hypothetical protein
MLGGAFDVEGLDPVLQGGGQFAGGTAELLKEKLSVRPQVLDGLSCDEALRRRIEQANLTDVQRETGWGAD